jgi:hypothetical protein
MLSVVMNHKKNYKKSTFSSRSIIIQQSHVTEKF